MEIEENEILEINDIEKDKLFNQFSNKITYDKININEKINDQDQYFTKFIIQTLGKDAIKRKPESLIRLENQLKTYFFGKNGSLIDLIPKLKAELLKNERKKDDKLDEKIEIGDLVYLNQLYDKTIGLEKRASINKQRSELLLSNNFARTNKFKTRKIPLKEKNKYSFFYNFSQKNIKTIKSISSKESTLNNSIKKLSNKKIDTSQDNSNSKISIFQKPIPTKKLNYTINNSNNNISSNFNHIFKPSNSQRILNLKNSNYNSIFKRKRNKLNLFNYTPEKDKKIEQYSIQKPIIFNSYLKTSYNLKLKKSISNYKTFRNEKIKILNKLNDYSLHEKKISKSLHDIINKNKLIKKNTFIKDIEILFDENMNLDKYYSMKELLNERNKNKKNKTQKTLILNTNDSKSDNEIKKLINKRRNIEKENKITDHIFERDNKLNRIKKKLKHGIELIHSMGNKLTLEHLKLKEKLNDITNERNIIIKAKKNYN